MMWKSIALRRMDYGTTIESEQGNVTLVLDMSLDDDLLSKGLARDIIRRVQAKRGNEPKDRSGDLAGDRFGPYSPSSQRMTGITFSLKQGLLRVI